MATITLSNIPDLTAAVSTPRVAAIEYPFGRTVGQPGGSAGQLAVLPRHPASAGRDRYPRRSQTLTF